MVLVTLFGVKFEGLNREGLIPITMTKLSMDYPEEESDNDDNINADTYLH